VPDGVEPSKEQMRRMVLVEEEDRYGGRRKEEASKGSRRSGGRSLCGGRALALICDEVYSVGFAYCEPLCWFFIVFDVLVQSNLWEAKVALAKHLVRLFLFKNDQMILICIHSPKSIKLIGITPYFKSIGPR
jgi:hypothetical protein